MNKALTDEVNNPDIIHCSATVVSSSRITPPKSDTEVRELVLDLDSPLLTVRPGQNLAVKAPVPEGSSEKEHIRFYSIADVLPSGPDGLPRAAICVRRCLPEGRQEKVYYGMSSNYLCNLEAGDTLEVTGPFGFPFEIPKHMDANLILIGTGTGIAPFRGFVNYIYSSVPDWAGKIWLFYGAESGLEFLYMNDHQDDLSRYFDESTFEAFQSLCEKPNWADPLAWDFAFAERGAELWKMLADEKTYVYVAGLEIMERGLDGVFSQLAGGGHKWAARKKELIASNRWVELLY